MKRQLWRLATQRGVSHTVHQSRKCPKLVRYTKKRDPRPTAPEYAAAAGFKECTLCFLYPPGHYDPPAGAGKWKNPEAQRRHLAQLAKDNLGRLRGRPKPNRAPCHRCGASRAHEPVPAPVMKDRPVCSFCVLQARIRADIGTLPHNLEGIEQPLIRRHLRSLVGNEKKTVKLKAHHVFVQLDGDDHADPWHPADVEVL